MSDGVKSNDAGTVTLPASAFYLLITSIGFGGAGAGGVLGERLDQQLLDSVRKTADSALTIATQNASRGEAARVELINRTADRFTNGDHDRFVREQTQRDNDQNRRIESLEREVDKLTR